MTVQAHTVCRECDIKPTEVPLLEKFLAKISPEMLIKLMWSKDPNGEHDLEWFRPFIDHGVIKNAFNIDVIFDDEFWKAYTIVDIYCDDFQTFHFPAINKMKEDLERLKYCCANAKIKVLPYIAALYSDDIYSIKRVENNLDKVSDIMIGNSGIQIRETI